MTQTLSMPTDLAIARSATLRPIHEVAAELGIPTELVEPYGRHVGKIDLAALSATASRPQGRYILVSAITPTPLGEGKTTVAIGLAQALRALGQRAAVTLRQPSLGPTFGIKGGAAGGGYSQVVPMEAVNLHLTGDFHAVTAAHNLLAAMVDNALHHRNGALHHRSRPDLDPRSVSWRRVLDVDDRALRNIVLGLGARVDGVPRQSGFDITAASEVMAILALATSLPDLRARLGRLVVGFTVDGEPVTAEQLKAAGAMAVLLREAIKPNLLQTLEGGPAFVHTGPFGNIATGNSSVVADLLAVHTADYVVTEAGFGADMGAERFVNLKCRVSGLRPDAAVLVATVRAVKAHSGRYQVKAGRPLPAGLLTENPDDVHAGAANLHAQLANLRRHGLEPVVAINAFPTDYPSEHEVLRELAAAAGARVAVTTHVRDGGAGATELAHAVMAAADQPTMVRFLYPSETPLPAKIERIAREVYGADGAELGPGVAAELDRFDRLGYAALPVCIAKTHLSLSADPTLTGAPRGWRLPVREVRLAAGAGYVYAVCGDIRTMPGLPVSPAAERIDLDAQGQVVGLS